MKHTQQDQNFALRILPFSGGIVGWLMRPQFRSIDVGSLALYLADELTHLPFVLGSAVDFTLVNVRSRMSMRSHGCTSYLLPDECAINTAVLEFTFALTPEQEFAIPTGVWMKSSMVKTWATDNKAAPMFVTVGITMVKAAKWGLKALLPVRMQYLYNMMGVITKNIIRYHTNYMMCRDRPFFDHTLAGEVKIPFASMVERVPYSQWCFHHQVLDECPNILPTKCLTPEFVAYACSVLKLGASTFMPHVADDVGWRLLSTDPDSVQQQLSKSVVNLLSLINAPGDYQFTLNDKLAISMVYTLITENRARFDPHADYLDLAAALIDAMSRHVDEVSSLLTPPDDAARKLLTSDSALRRHLTDLLYEEL